MHQLHPPAAPARPGSKSQACDSPPPVGFDPDSLFDDTPLVTQPIATTNCPVCGCDVADCVETVGDDGLRRWTRPLKEAWHQGRHFRDLTGGLVHIERGKRCLSDAEGWSL